MTENPLLAPAPARHDRAGSAADRQRRCRRTRRRPVPNRPRRRCRTFAAVAPQTRWAQNAVDNSYGPLDGDRASGLRSTSTQLPLTGAHSASSKDRPRSRARLSGSELG